ncbi:hypothetical protein GJ744_008491 [Endocarpon pusillum]|uniref:Uncharacterized protein n=1 Tax=Endocarpon pusillum TaxID=364733 RepID=A0A8H7AGX5_9EURO|nr:hypothetical protein GJ744_008491 [Endocarpon pusillum]
MSPPCTFVWPVIRGGSSGDLPLLVDDVGSSSFLVRSEARKQKLRKYDSSSATSNGLTLKASYGYTLFRD